jgi:hypothetical protein
MAIWAGLPVMLWINPGFFGLLEAHTDLHGFVLNVGWLWLALGVGGLVFRVLQLAFTQNLLTGLVWATKIITDPVHDIALYWKSPWYLLQGEWIAAPEHLHAEREQHELELARNQG